MRKFLKITFLSLLSLIVLSVLFLVLFFNMAPQVGKSASGTRLERMKQATNYHDGKFENVIPTSMDMSFSNLTDVLWEMVRGNKSREPVVPIKTYAFNPEKLDSAGVDNVAITWFGHSSLLIKIDGKVFLTDPVFSDRASMFPFAGPKRFDYTEPMSVEKLPFVDAVIISHDHYDHLDYETIVKLKDKVSRFFVPLGVGAHLESWGVPASSITELNWWETASFDENIQIISTPARHFSGRGITNRMSTLWGSWVIRGKSQRVFFSGDSGYFPGFKEVGEKYGPFDITLLECGQYNTRWAEIHMMPEQTAQAHLDLKGRVLMPIHWGKFNLALHGWKEPVERLTAKAKVLHITVATPIVGELVLVPKYLPHERWWEDYQ